MTVGLTRALDWVGVWSAPTRSENLEQRGEQTWSGWLSKVPSHHWLALLLLMALGMWVRWRFIEGPMRYDEAFTVWRYSTNSFSAAVASYSTPNNHIFHTVLVHLAYRITGDMAPAIVRLPAFLGGVMLIPLGFATIGRLAGLTSGLVTAAAVAGSSALIDFSVNARGYTLAAAISLLALAVVVEMRSRSERAPWWALLVLASLGALGLWTIPVFAYAWVPILIWMSVPAKTRSWFVSARESLVTGFASLAIAATLYAPAIINDGLAALAGNRFVESEPFGQFIDRQAMFLDGVQGIWTHNVPVFLVLAFVLGLLLAAWGLAGADVRSLAWSIFVGVVAVHLIVRATPPPRVWIIILPLVLGISAAGLGVVLDRTVVGRASAGWFKATLAIAIGVSMTAAAVDAGRPLTGESDGFIDAEAAALVLEPLITEDSYVAAYGSSTAPLRYYFELHGLPIRALREPDHRPTRLFVVTAPDQDAQSVLERTNLDFVEGRLVLLAEYESGVVWELDTD